jgi:outer membrane protein, multidrug efflux system
MLDVLGIHRSTDGHTASLLCLRSVLSGCFIIAMAGCISQPQPAADLRLPATYEASPSANVAAASSPASSIDRWWLSFDDAQLNTLVDQTLLANPDIKTAAARVREAAAARSSVLTRFLPQGNAAASISRTDTTQHEGPVVNLPDGVMIPGLTTGGGISDASNASFNVSWEVDLFGRLFATRRATKADVAAAQFDFESTRASLAAQVADAYFQARGLAIQLNDARETVRIKRELYDIAVKRTRAGLSAGAEPDRVAGDLARSDAQVTALEAELKIQRRTILILAGRTFDPISSVETLPSVGTAPSVPTFLPSDLLRRRPDVRSAEVQVRGALGREDLARLAFLPTFKLQPGVGWSRSVQSGTTFVTSSWSIGAAVVQPVLDIPNLLAQLHIQNARTAQTVAAYEKTLQTAFGEAEGALLRLDAERQRVALLSDGEARAQRAYNAAHLGYTRGLNDLESALTSEQSWRATRADLTAAQVGALRQSIAAFKSLGGGWPADAFAE